MHMIKIAINSQKEAYEFLGLDPTKQYTAEEISKAHKKKIIQHHPDRFANADKKIQDAAAEATSKANRARDYVTGKGAYNNRSNYSNERSSSYYNRSNYSKERANNYNYYEQTRARERERASEERAREQARARERERERSERERAERSYYNRGYDDSKQKTNLNRKHISDASARAFGYNSLLYGATVANSFNPDLKAKRKINRMAIGAVAGNLAGMAGGLYGVHKGYLGDKGLSAVQHGSVLGGAGLGYLYNKRKEMKKTASVHFYDDNKISKKKYEALETPGEHHMDFKRDKGVGDQIRSRSPKNTKEHLDRLKYMGANALGAGTAGVLLGSVLDPHDVKVQGFSTLGGAIGGGLMGAYVGNKRWQASKK